MRIVLAVVLAGTLVSCGGGKKPDDQAFLNSLDSGKNAGATVNEQVLSKVLQEIPSPLEISSMLQKSGTKYDNGFLNSPDNLSRYNSNYKKALNLGIYGTDLGYTNIYQKNDDGVKYLTSIKSLADGLNIGQFFDIGTIGRLAANSKNLDSLLLITTQNFNTINHYLQTENRANLSVLLLTGGWLEAVHITCQVAAKDPGNKELTEKIGEQKIILNELVKLYEFYQNDDNMSGLAKDLAGLKAEFDKITITYTYKESTMEVVNGVAVIKDNSTTTIDITPENVKNIRELANSIRTKIIS